MLYLMGHAGVAELADAPDLGSGVPDVQVQVLSPAPVESLDTLFRVLRLFFFMVSTSRLRLVMNTHFFNIK